MRLFRDFYRQQAPKSAGETVLYYQQSLSLNEILTAAYFAVSFFLLSFAVGQILWAPLILLGALLTKRYLGASFSIRINLLVHALIMVSWCGWYVVEFGWKYEAQHILVLIILLVFFSLYEQPRIKILYFLGTLLARTLLYDYTVSAVPRYELADLYGFFAQLTNSLFTFFTIACCCIIYSSNLQESERQLLLHNEQLQRQAETDPLTKLFNRRCLMGEMNRFTAQNPRETYCVAIADIDFFKRVNDTYGHNCGDYVLKTLSSLFMDMSEGRYSVGRWGGEEFCFFLPGMNIDDAGRIITDVCTAVRKMPLEYEGSRFSITLTAGVEENDFHSPLEALIDSADQKLYMGKRSGRDQIVI